MRVNTEKLIEFLKENMDVCYENMMAEKEANNFYDAAEAHEEYSVYEFLVDVLENRGDEMHEEIRERIMEEPEEVGRTLKRLKEALEKQIPKKPIEKDGWIACPYCEMSTSGRMYAPWCDNCGQAIDWSEVE